MNPSKSPVDAFGISGEHIYLTGYRACGKSTVAIELGRRLDRHSVDLDDVVEELEQRSIAEIFQQSGEAAFRQREHEALTMVSQRGLLVVALGGGAILRPENRAIIRLTGHCVWLDARPDVIAKRLADDPSTASRRPSLTGRPSVIDEIGTVMNQRRSAYAEVADHRLDASDASVSQLCDQIIDWLPA